MQGCLYMTCTVFSLWIKLNLWKYLCIDEGRVKSVLQLKKLLYNCVPLLNSRALNTFDGDFITGLMKKASQFVKVLSFHINTVFMFLPPSPTVSNSCQYVFPIRSEVKSFYKDRRIKRKHNRFLRRIYFSVLYFS